MSKSFKEVFLKNLVGSTEPDTLRQIALDTTILKAMDTDATGSEFISNSRIDDQGKGSLNDARRLTKEEVNLGSPQAASGGNAEKQVKEFSNFDPQQAIVENYNALSADLGALKSMMKNFLDAFGAATAATAKAEDEEEDKKEASKSTLSPEAAAIKAMADEMEDEEEDKKEASKAATVDSSGPVKAAAMLVKAAEELEARSLAAKKAGDSVKFKSLKGKVEEALQKALQMIASAPDRASLTAKSLASDIHALALVKGFSAVAALAAKAEEEEEDKEKDASKSAKASEADHMQEEWPTSTKAESQATMDRVLKGLAILEGNMGTLFEAVAGKSKGEGLKALDLGLAAKSQTPSDPKLSDPTALYKSNPDAWELIKVEQIQQQVDNGVFGLQEELACQAILSTAQAARAGAIPNEQLVSRVRSASEMVRGMFPELLAA